MATSYMFNHSSLSLLAAMGITYLPSSIIMSSMPPEVVIAEEIGRARMLTLNRPKHLNFISGKVALTSKLSHATCGVKKF
ncbi:hypothetical protein KY290_031572 [Solanum tuberosum]|uniref:Uncharacterized protein n=1 Tax=Solanum tuberosum TaxID=4113 RepID=A0ABQ7UAA6_SOLTU|nr:hypothetical protein KY285_030807 [Solanum tuberosum]KAH0743579.1 hypothetical protein KY290_031572 [Solanum tuberosum]